MLFLLFFLTIGTFSQEWNEVHIRTNLTCRGEWKVKSFVIYQLFQEVPSKNNLLKDGISQGEGDKLRELIIQTNITLNPNLVLRLYHKCHEKTLKEWKYLTLGIPSNATSQGEVLNLGGSLELATFQTPVDSGYLVEIPFHK